MSIIKYIKELNLVKVSLLVVAILIITNLWTFLDTQNQIASLETEIDSLNSSYENLEQNYQSLNETYQNYVATYNVSLTDYLSLNTTYNALFLDYENYKSSHNYTNTEYEELSNELEQLKTPKLSDLSIYSEDVRPQAQSPRLHIHGEVWNVGSNIAYNCGLHIVAYQGSVRAIDKEIILGSIFGENRVTLDEFVFYEGDALTNWFITVTWTLSP